MSNLPIERGHIPLLRRFGCKDTTFYRNRQISVDLFFGSLMYTRTTLHACKTRRGEYVSCHQGHGDYYLSTIEGLLPHPIFGKKK